MLRKALTWTIYKFSLMLLVLNISPTKCMLIMKKKIITSQKERGVIGLLKKTMTNFFFNGCIQKQKSVKLYSKMRVCISWVFSYSLDFEKCPNLNIYRTNSPLVSFPYFEYRFNYYLIQHIIYPVTKKLVSRLTCASVTIQVICCVTI